VPLVHAETAGRYFAGMYMWFSVIKTRCGQRRVDYSVGVAFELGRD